MKERKKLSKTFLKYLIPSVSAMWFFSIYTMVDGIFVSRGVGTIALAAVSLSMPYINAIFAISLLIAVGSSTLISFHLGRDEIHKSREIFTLSFIIISLIGIFTSAISFIYLEELSLFLGATKETLKYTMDYLGIIIIFTTFFMLAYSLEVLVKADGFPIYSIVFVSVAAVTNIILDYILVIVFDYGVAGAAFATGLSQLISFLGFLYHFLMGPSKLKFKKVNMDFRLIKSIFSIGLPEALTELSAGITIFLFNYAISKSIGDMGLTAFGVIMYINNLVIMTMIAINQGIQPLISFYNGRKEDGNIQYILKLAFKSVLVFSLFLVVGSQFFADMIVNMFISPSNRQVYDLAKYSLKIFSTSFLFCGFNILISGYFSALKEIKKAIIISLLRGFILIPFILLILPNFIGSVGIWLSPLVNEVITIVFSLNIFSNYKKSRSKSVDNKARILSVEL